MKTFFIIITAILLMSNTSKDNRLRLPVNKAHPTIVYSYSDNNASFKIAIDSVINKKMYVTMNLKNISPNNDTVIYYNLPVWSLFQSKGELYCSIADNNLVTETKEELLLLLKSKEVVKHFTIDAINISKLPVSFSYFLNFQSSVMEYKIKNDKTIIQIDHGFSFTGKYFETNFPLCFYPTTK